MSVLETMLTDDEKVINDGEIAALGSPMQEVTPSKPNLLISFSGGETSAYMTQWLLKNRENYGDVRVVFANTGEENEETLVFVDLCDKHFGFEVIWLEAVMFPTERKAPDFKIVTFETAARKGEPFEAMISKYGIPNVKFRNCTRDLKQRPIEAYAKSIGWGTSYVTAIGIRADEMDRLTDGRTRRLVYPLAKDHPRTKPQINAWWGQQSFRLTLKSYQGNCKWCWKKSMRKHFTIIGENPEFYDFPRRMEETYGHIGPEFTKYPQRPGYRRTFFREARSVEDLFKAHAELGTDFVPATDDAQVYDYELDTGGACGESCEVFSDEPELPEASSQYDLFELIAAE